MSKQITLKELEKKFRKWRSSGKKGGIPEELWKMVALLPAEDSVNEITKTLSLEWHKVKRLRRGVVQEVPLQEFIEVRGSVPIHHEIIIERRDGSRLILPMVEDIGLIITSFLGAEK